MGFQFFWGGGAVLGGPGRFAPPVRFLSPLASAFYLALSAPPLRARRALRLSAVAAVALCRAPLCVLRVTGAPFARGKEAPVSAGGASGGPRGVVPTAWASSTASRGAPMSRPKIPPTAPRASPPGMAATSTDG